MGEFQQRIADLQTDGFSKRDIVENAADIGLEADKVIAGADARIAELERENAELREDAERWRRLRGHHWTTDRLVVAHPHDLKLGSMTYSGERLDAAIDAARAAGRESSNDD